MALEQAAKEHFGMIFDVGTVIARNIDVGRAAKATVFLTSKKQLMCYIHGPTRLLLGDVKKIVSRVGLKPELFMPPKGQSHYFDDVALEKFRNVFPGRSKPNESDLAFYRTLAPYSPALVLISEVKNGVIYCADSDARSGWRPITKFAYRRIKTS